MKKTSIGRVHVVFITVIALHVKKVSFIDKFEIPVDQ